MDEKRFWDIIAVGCPKEPGASWLDELIAQLVRLPIDEIDSFARLLDSKLRAACTIDLWAAVSLVDPSEDMEFLHFCNWLVGMGKPVYESALQDSDSLAERIQADEDFLADLTNITRLAWSEAAGQPENNFWTGKDLLGWPTLEDMAGERWDFTNRSEVKKRFPRLAARYLDSEEVDE